ncbi:MAG: type II toxin-antitoxin system PemK/MazF family toxin [Deltaproteobacteria bacterium]|nr:type II toxin-antitoxin system PemK/MazF family toxin [Deltaproteobacteria bacterium]
MPTTTTYKPGEIALVGFPFTDLSSAKKRPALILRSFSVPSLPRLIIIAMITSQLEGIKLEGDYEIRQWQAAGLLHPSKLRLAKLVTLEEKLIFKKLGSLTETDKKPVRRILKNFFQL